MLLFTFSIVGDKVGIVNFSWMGYNTLGAFLALAALGAAGVGLLGAAWVGVGVAFWASATST